MHMMCRALVELGNLGDHKMLEDGIFELRFHFGPGYDIFAPSRGQSDRY